MSETQITRWCEHGNFLFRNNQMVVVDDRGNIRHNIRERLQIDLNYDKEIVKVSTLGTRKEELKVEKLTWKKLGLE